MTTTTVTAPVRLSVQGLAKSYETKAGPVPVIADLTFDVHAGEVCCIVGPSGIGKTTLLKCLTGLQSITAGSAAIDGTPIDGPPEEMALVFQEYTRSLMPWLTVEKNVRLPLKHLRLPAAEREERIAAALSAVGLSGAESKFPWQLSGGMQQRVAIARAIAYRPEVLGLDDHGLRASLDLARDPQQVHHLLWVESAHRARSQNGVESDDRVVENRCRSAFHTSIQQKATDIRRPDNPRSEQYSSTPDLLLLHP